jgi:GNAT superfamily N-acetyltransferase
MNTIQIKKATVEVLDELAALFDAYRVFYQKPSDISGAVNFLRDRLTHCDSEIFVSFQENTLTGFTQLYPLFSSARMRKLWLLNDLFVDEKFRGQGISLALMDRAKALCLESHACGFILETAKSNIIGNRLYQRAGLALDHDHNYYSWDV